MINRELEMRYNLELERDYNKYRCEEIIDNNKINNIQTLHIKNYLFEQKRYIYERIKDKLKYNSIKDILEDLEDSLFESNLSYRINLYKIKRWFGNIHLGFFIKKFLFYFREGVDFIYKDIDIFVNKRALLSYCIYINSFESLKLYNILMKIDDIFRECTYELYNYKMLECNIINLKLNSYQNKIEC